MTKTTKSEKKIRVALLDDDFQIHKIVQSVLGATADVELVAQGSHGDNVVELCNQFHPDIILMDVVMPVMDGIEATKILQQNFKDIKILVLSSYQDHEKVYEMLQYGASGYLTKSALSQDLADTIRTTYHGKRVFSGDVISQLMGAIDPPRKPDFHLTGREMEVLALMASGMNVPEMARKLVIGQSTVKFHVDNICNKFNVRTKSEALIIATRNKLI